MPEPSSKSKINWGIIGPGRIAHKFASDLQLSEFGELLAVASRNQERAEGFGSQYGATKFFDTYQQLVEEPNIDIVYIATPHHLHFENALMCIQHGKSVLCEKPMGLDFSQVETLVEEAKKHDVFLMEGMWTRFIPATNKLLELLERHIIGELIQVHADFGFKGDYDPENRLFNKALGGGSLMDIGIYPVYISQLLFGAPVEVSANARMSETGVDASLNMIFTNENGTMSNLHSSFEHFSPLEAVIYGTEGHIKLHTPFHHSEKISVYKNNELVEEIDLPINGYGYFYEIEEANKCLINGRKESSAYSLSNSLSLIETLDRVKAEIGLDYSV